MSHVASCPRCPRPLRRRPPAWVCAVHGEVPALWRSEVASYETFAEHLRRAGDFPSCLLWPVPPGWQVTGFAACGEPGRVRASLTSATGTTPHDGVVDVLLVSEEPGTGLGARVAGLAVSDPVVPDEPPAARVQLEQVGVALWSLPADGARDGAVLVGEAHGRWLWVVVRPTGAVLLLTRWNQVRDVSRLGPALLEVDFGGIAPNW